jgi:hypothetical protein
VTVNVLPPTEIVPEREPAPGLASTAYVTRRLPVPRPPGGSTTRIHGAPLTAAHAQVDEADTSKLPVPLSVGNVSPGLLRSTVQAVAPACVTMCVVPPTDSPAMRADRSGLASAR